MECPDYSLIVKYNNYFTFLKIIGFSILMEITSPQRKQNVYILLDPIENFLFTGFTGKKLFLLQIHHPYTLDMYFPPSTSTPYIFHNN